MQNYHILVAFPVQSTEVQLASQCFVAACILWRDWDTWLFTQAVGVHFDPRCRETNWRHDRPGPHLRWESVFVKSFGDQWKRHAAAVSWKQQRGAFRRKAYEIFNARPFEDRFQMKSKVVVKGPLKKRARSVHRVPFAWGSQVSGRRLEIVGDSMLVIQWISGIWR